MPGCQNTACAPLAAPAAGRGRDLTKIEPNRRISNSPPDAAASGALTSSCFEGMRKVSTAPATRVAVFESQNDQGGDPARRGYRNCVRVKRSGARQWSPACSFSSSPRSNATATASRRFVTLSLA